MNAAAIKIHGVTVCKNEADRFLVSCLKWNSRFCDDIFVYDDMSEDNSVALASPYATVVQRSNYVPTFLEDESAFRQAGWNAFQSYMKPREWDFVLAFDLDEFWFGPDLHTIAAEWDYEFTGGIVRRPEMWSIEDPLVRVDNLWKTIENIRFWPFKHGGEFRNRKLAGGSHPTYAAQKTQRIPGSLLHFGYSTEVDRKTRYDRYINRPGHNHNHIKSILVGGNTVAGLDVNPEWEYPEVFRGRK